MLHQTVLPKTHMDACLQQQVYHILVGTVLGTVKGRGSVLHMWNATKHSRERVSRNAGVLERLYVGN